MVQTNEIYPSPVLAEYCLDYLACLIMLSICIFQYVIQWLKQSCCGGKPIIYGSLKHKGEKLCVYEFIIFESSTLLLKLKKIFFF